MSELLISIFIHLLFFDARIHLQLMMLINDNDNDNATDDNIIHRDQDHFQDRSPRIRRANCMSLGKMVTLLA